MTIWARSDVSYVGISADHGGCGQGHSRPVVDGNPAKIWALTCHGGCEDHLRSDPLWASTPQTIPETPDETIYRLDLEQRGEHERAESTTDALNKLAAMPDVLAQFMRFMVDGTPTSPPPPEPVETVECDAGHPNALSAKYCAECGSPVGDAVLPPEEAVEPPPAEGLNALSLAALRTRCKDLGLPTTGNKSDLIARLESA